MIMHRRFLTFFVLAVVAVTPIWALGYVGDPSLRVEITRPLIFDVPASGSRLCLPSETDPGGQVEIVGQPHALVSLDLSDGKVVGIDKGNQGQIILMDSLSGSGDFFIPQNGILSVDIGGCVNLSDPSLRPGRYIFAGNVLAIYL